MKKKQPKKELELLKKRLRIETGAAPPDIAEIKLALCDFIVKEPVYDDYLLSASFKTLTAIVRSVLIYVRGTDGDFIDSAPLLFKLGKQLENLPISVLDILYSKCVDMFPHADYELAKKVPDEFFNEFVFIDPKKSSPFVNTKITVLRNKTIDRFVHTLEKIFGTLWEPEDFKTQSVGGTITKPAVRVPLAMAIRPEMMDKLKNQVMRMGHEVAMARELMPDIRDDKIETGTLGYDKDDDPDFVTMPGDIKIPREAVNVVRRQVGNEIIETEIVNLYYYPKKIYKQIMATTSSKVNQKLKKFEQPKQSKGRKK